MTRDRSDPMNVGLLHRRIWIQPLGDGVADEGLALFLQQIDEPLLLRNQLVDLGSLVVEEGGNGALNGKRRIWNSCFENIIR